MLSWPIGLVLLASVASASQHHPQYHFPRPSKPSESDCLSSATSAELNARLWATGPKAQIVLCPYALVTVDSRGPPITFTDHSQAIFTEGYPEDDSRASIVIAHPKGLVNGELTTAIKADCELCQGVEITHVQIDGGRKELGGVEGGDAMILVGGKVGEQQVRNVNAGHARGYAVIHASEGPQANCTGVIISENSIHSSGDSPLDVMLNSELVRLRDGPAPHLGQRRPGHYSDGISVACSQSIVSENSIQDVSGIAIAVRGSAGSQIVQNTIIARDRDMLVGIAIIAHPAFTKLREAAPGISVRENSIHAVSAMIRVGISTGSATWSVDEAEHVLDSEIPFHSEVVNNRLSSHRGYFSYAIALSDAKSIVVTGNAISASLWGFRTPSCREDPAFVAPSPLIRDTRTVRGQVQKEFRAVHFGFLLCVGPGTASDDFEMSRHQINEKYIHTADAKKGKKAKARDGIPLKSLKDMDRGRTHSGGKWMGTPEVESPNLGMKRRKLAAPRRRS